MWSSLHKLLTMKKFYILFVATLLTAGVFAQDKEIKSADKGVTYGAGTTADGAITAADLEKKMKDDKYQGKVTGKVTEVCQEKGCWMKLEQSNGQTLMVKFKDYGFFMPKNIVGKDVVLDGEAIIKRVSVKQQQHYAKDAGKSEAEIKQIKKEKKELQFVAAGVLVL